MAPRMGPCGLGWPPSMATRLPPASAHTLPSYRLFPRLQPGHLPHVGRKRATFPTWILTGPPVALGTRFQLLAGSAGPAQTPQSHPFL